MTTQISGQTVTKLKIGTGPYIKHSMTLPRIMRTVLYSTLPICAFSVYLFGISSLLLILFTTFVTVGTELLFQIKISRISSLMTHVFVLGASDAILFLRKKIIEFCISGRKSLETENSKQKKRQELKEEAKIAYLQSKKGFSFKDASINDWSAAVTGVLLALTLPPGFPLWMAGIAGFFAITFGKVFFGGLGNNIFNPALIGRAFIQSAFPVATTTWIPPFALHRFTETIPSTFTPPLSIPTSIIDWLTTIQVDGFTGATPLTLFKFQHIASDPLAMVTGFTSGSTGETCAILILLCGAYLCWRKIADWRIPASILLGATLTGAIFYLINAQAYPDPLFILTSGGLLFGAVFMATDPVGAPITPRGRIVFGLFIGFLIVIIRIFSSYPEGVMYAILWGNAISPTINRLTQLKPYGTKGGVK